MKNYFVYKFDLIGKLMIVEKDGFITQVDFVKSNDIANDSLLKESALIKQTHIQLLEYFADKRNFFDLPLNPQGTVFQLSCYNELLNIPYGETRSYQQVAVAVDCPKGCRAVGMAANRNPIAILIPCHRVIGKNGALVGFGGGLEIKKNLLDLESKNINI